ncbi:GTP cyclohydrolase 1 [Sphingopyxis sp. EG6]|nr:GTP cyclohydrolase 1 [Sphingopyxis sp. EG6]
MPRDRAIGVSGAARYHHGVARRAEVARRIARTADTVAQRQGGNAMAAVGHADLHLAGPRAVRAGIGGAGRLGQREQEKDRRGDARQKKGPASSASGGRGSHAPTL